MSGKKAELEDRYRPIYIYSKKNDLHSIIFSLVQFFLHEIAEIMHPCFNNGEDTTLSRGFVGLYTRYRI